MARSQEPNQWHNQRGETLMYLYISPYLTAHSASTKCARCADVPNFHNTASQDGPPGTFSAPGARQRPIIKITQVPIFEVTQACLRCSAHLSLSWT